MSGLRLTTGKLIPSAPWLNGLIFLAAGALLISRDPNRLWRPEFWAEDGDVWLKQAYLFGPKCLVMAHTGYLQTISRLGALAAVCLPLTYAPAIFAALAFVIQLAPVAFLLSARGTAGLPSLAMRLLIIAYYIGEPNSYEVSINLTNSMWHLAILAFMVLVFPKPCSRSGVTLDISVLILSGLSGPFVIANAILSIWEAWHSRRVMARIYAAVTCGCAVLQVGYLEFSTQTGRNLINGATIMGFIKIVDHQIFVSGIIGAWLTTGLDQMAWWQSELTSCVLFLAGFLLFVTGFWLSNSIGRKFILFTAAVLAAGLYSPLVSADRHQWLHLETPFIGTRYFVLPMLGFVVCLLSIAAARYPVWLKFLGRGLVAACLIGIIWDWRMIPFNHAGYWTAMTEFETAPSGTKFNIPENPPGWFFRITKK